MPLMRGPLFVMSSIYYFSYNASKSIMLLLLRGAAKFASFRYSENNCKKPVGPVAKSFFATDPTGRCSEKPKTFFVFVNKLKF